MKTFLKRQWPAVLVIITGLLLSFGAFLSIRAELGERHRLEFMWVAQDRNRALKKGIEEGLDAVRSVRDLFQASDHVEAQAFDRFTQALFKRYHGIQALAWLPLVRAHQREEYELEAGQGIVEPGGQADGESMQVAQPRDWHFPVRYQRAPQGRGLVPGCDQAAIAVRRVLLERAWVSGQMVVSGRIPLPQVVGEAQQFGFMAFQPVFAELSQSAGESERQAALQGFAVGVFHIADLADASTRLLEPRGVEFMLRDESAPPEEQLLDFYLSRLDRQFHGTQKYNTKPSWNQSNSPKETETFKVADRLWSITCSATTQFRSGEGFGQGHWIVLGGGLLLTLIMTLFILHTRASMRVRMRIEEDLRGSEQKLRVLFDQSPDIIMTLDRNGCVLIINRSMPGVSNTAEGGCDLAFIPERARERFRQSLERVFTSGEPAVLSYTRDDSTWWDLRIVPLRVRRQVSTAMVIATDVTEKRQLEAHAIRTARLASLGVLAASVAHEINNPNNAIQFNASILSRSWEDILRILEKYRLTNGEFTVGGVPVEKALDGMPRLLEGIVRSTQRIQHIVGNLKHMARPDKGDLDHRVDLVEVLQITLSILQSQIQKHTDQCHLQLPLNLPAVRGNAQQLEQVFINLVMNALQALPARSAGVTVSAELEPEGEQVRVTVIDQGCGISEDIKSRVTDPFFTTKGSGGTGLGLSISARIVQAHSGRLEISSQPGSGTRVSVLLPVFSH